MLHLRWLPNACLQRCVVWTSAGAAPRTFSSSSHHSVSMSSAAAPAVFFSAAIQGEVTDPEAHYRSFDMRVRVALMQQLCSPETPLPLKAVYLQLCHPFRVVKEMYHTQDPKRHAKLRSALRFLRRHNVLLHSLLFYVPESRLWHTTAEFTRLRLFGESYLHAEIRMRLLKLMPEMPEEVYLEFLRRYLQEEQYVKLFDMLDMSSLVGSRPAKPGQLRTKQKKKRKAEISDIAAGDRTEDRRSGAETDPTAKRMLDDTYSGASPPPSEEAREALRHQRLVYRQEFQLTPHQKASMLCAVLGELRWFCLRTRPTHRTHNNAIFPPSDVLILHVLAQHLLECIPAEMVFAPLKPSIARIYETWPNFHVSLPSQIRERHFPRPSAYHLAETSHGVESALAGAPSDLPTCHVTAERPSLSPLPVKDCIISTMRPQLAVRGIEAGARSAQFRVFTRSKDPVERDALLQSAPQPTQKELENEEGMDLERAWKLGLGNID